MAGANLLSVRQRMKTNGDAGLRTTQGNAQTYLRTQLAALYTYGAVAAHVHHSNSAAATEVAGGKEGRQARLPAAVRRSSFRVLP